MPIYPVSQVASYLRELLERDSLLRELWVSGEVANLARAASGHSYFTLTERSSSLRCVMFRSALGAERLDNGAAVVAHGRISLYEVRGDLQMIVDIVQPEGVGELQLKLERLKLKLQHEGLFEPSRKRSLPEFPRRVGVVTSPTGAVWHDIRTVTSRRYPVAELLLAPTAVQGETAAAGIVEAFHALNEEPNVDVVILARGGGSLEDMWAFNEETVARAVYGSRAPVISAIGHETDHTIADMVADRRASTPSAAAEMAVPDRQALETRLLVHGQALASSIAGHLAMGSNSLENLGRRLGRRRPDLDSLRMRVDDVLRDAKTHLNHSMAVKTERFEGLHAQLESLSPRQTLRRGYAIVERRADGALVSEAAQLNTGDPIGITLNKGAAEAEVVSVTRETETPKAKVRNGEAQNRT